MGPLIKLTKADVIKTENCGTKERFKQEMKEKKKNIEGENVQSVFCKRIERQDRYREPMSMDKEE